jgi:hypothetical protein
VEGLSLFLILKAFTAGCTALTGVEAISDGVPAFQRPEADNATKTLVWMLILGDVHRPFFPRASLRHRTECHRDGRLTDRPHDCRAQFFYYFIQAMTALILVLAANTRFRGLPRLSTWLAKDHFMPKQFLFRGDRLAFNTGITVLGVLATILLLPSVARPTGCCRSMRSASSRHSHSRSPAWCCTGTSAAGLDAPLRPQPRWCDGNLLRPHPRHCDEVHGRRVDRPHSDAALILLFRGINRHYVRAAAELALGDDDAPSAYQKSEQVVIIPIADMNKSTVYALNYARTLAEDRRRPCDGRRRGGTSLAGKSGRSGARASTSLFWSRPTAR